MMYVPFKLRDHKGKVNPKGPNFNRARTIKSCIDNTCIEFKAPQHRPEIRGYKSTVPEKHNKFEGMYFDSNYNEYKLADDWKTFELFSHDWAFYGPWFSGVLAELRMDFYLFIPTVHKPHISYFHPRSFEQTVGDFLTNEYAKRKSHGRSKYVAPVNWHPLPHLGVPAAQLDVMPEELIHHPYRSHQVYFPIADQIMARIRFEPSQFLNLSQEDRDQKVDPSSMHELMDNIINSIQLTLSDSAKAQQVKAIKGLDDTSVIETFLPMKWTTQEQDAEWEAYTQSEEF